MAKYFVFFVSRNETEIKARSHSTYYDQIHCFYFEPSPPARLPPAPPTLDKRFDVETRLYLVHCCNSSKQARSARCDAIQSRYDDKLKNAWGLAPHRRRSEHRLVVYGAPSSRPIDTPP